MTPWEIEKFKYCLASKKRRNVKDSSPAACKSYVSVCGAMPPDLSGSSWIEKCSCTWTEHKDLSLMERRALDDLYTRLKAAEIAERIEKIAYGRGK